MKKTRQIRVITALVVALLLVVGMAEASLALAAPEQEGAPVMEENEAQTSSVSETGSDENAAGTDDTPADSENSGTDGNTSGNNDPTEDQPEAPTAPPDFSDLAPTIEGPKEVVPGDEIEVTISTIAEGTDSPIETEGLEFLSSDSELCHQFYMVLIPSIPGGETMNQVTLRYKVPEDAKDQVSLKLTQLHIAVPNPPHNIATLPPLTWTARVVEDIPEAAKSLRSRGHYFDFAGDAGFNFDVTDSGEAVLKGLTVSRTPQSVGVYAEKIIPPTNGSICFRGSDGNLLTSEDKIYTGCTIEALDREGRVLEETSVVVRGDLMGTGKASLQQLILLTKATTGTIELDELQFMAADHTDSRRIDIRDIRIQSNALLG